MTTKTQAVKAEVVKYLGDGVPYDRDKLIAEAKLWKGRLMKAVDSAFEATVNLGRRLHALKAAESHGSFCAALENIGLTRYQASQAMRCADAAERFNLLDSPVPKAHLLLLAQLPDDVTDEQLSEAGIDRESLEELKAAELRKRVRNLKENLDFGRKQFKQLQEKYDQLEAKYEDRDTPTTKKWLEEINEIKGALARVYNFYLKIPDNVSPKVQAALAALRTEELTLYLANGKTIERKFPALQDGGKTYAEQER